MEASLLKLKLDEFSDALTSLQEVLSMEKGDVVRDSAIKRFEYTFEASWKCSKVLLDTQYGVQVFSPKTCFRELRKAGLLSLEETETALHMTDDRNKVIHTYDENFADQLYLKIAQTYFSLLKVLFDAFQKIR